MSDDVEMVVAEQTAEVIVVEDSEPAASPANQSNDEPAASSSSPKPPDLQVISLDDSASSSSSSSQDGDVDEPVAKEEEKLPPSKPASTSGVKPKSKAAPARSRSPTPQPPPPPPVQTVRLDIPLGGPSNYEVNVASLSKDSGQRPPTPAQKGDISEDSHSEGDDEGSGKQEKKKRRRRKRNQGADGYDTSDSFIDDSELAHDERTHIAQTKQQGFYVSSGEIALAVDVVTPKKPKSRKLNIMDPAASINAALASANPSRAPLSLTVPPVKSSVPHPPSPTKLKPEDGTRDSPIALYSDTEDKTSLKRKLSQTNESMNGSIATTAPSSSAGNKKKRKIEVHPMHPKLEAMIEQLKAAKDKEDWAQKGKFPPGLKPMLSEVALEAIRLGEYDDNFFSVMPLIFPYNKFTMTKLIKRTVWKDHVGLLQERIDAGLAQLKEYADAGFAKAQEEYERSVYLWEKRHEKPKGDGEGAATNGTHVHSVEGTPIPSDGGGHATDGAQAGRDESGMDVDDSEKMREASAKDVHPPAKRYKLTDDMKMQIWQLVCLSNEIVRIENEKNQLENSTAVISDQGTRKNLYQRIVGAFPDGWLTSGQISREVSVLKKKSEKEAAELGE